ncbi:hypothetical protein [Cryobacterium sp. TMT1-21]|uniref:hypothetical protein n=1 Tax=Cryobacterium sp. TMT1-21 TaxID=1259234 RepID=UPI00141B4C32|nr:hypothetical protein [Cryobacterium sp. TMT1-21]
MSNLIPNAADLIAVLPSTKQAADALELVTAAAMAESIEELDRVLSAVVAGWSSE